MTKDVINNAVETQKILLDLYHHDAAACDIYKQVLSHIKDSKIESKIREFLRDHENHVKSLSDILDRISNKEVDKSRDMKSLFMLSYTALRSATGQGGALKALDTAEEILLERYQKASKENLNGEIRECVIQHLKDEEKHSAYVKQVIAELKL